MKWSINCSTLPAYISVAVEGDFNPADNRALWDEIIALKRWKPGTSVLIDGRRLQPPEDTEAFHALEAARYFVAKRDQIGSCFIAVCNISHDFYKYSREFQHDLLTKDLKVVIQNFPTEQSAVDWLRHLAEFSRRRPKPNHKHAAGSA